MEGDRHAGLAAGRQHAGGECGSTITYQVNLLAVSRAGKRIAHQLRSVRLQERRRDRAAGRSQGDAGDARRIARAAAGRARARARPRPARLYPGDRTGDRDAAGRAVDLVPVGIAFFAAAAVIVLLRAISLREAYDAIEWPILVMLGALIPLSDALRTTGGTDVIAGWLSRGRGRAAAARYAGADHGRGDGGDAVPQQRRDRAGDGADRGERSPRISGCRRIRS